MKRRRPLGEALAVLMAAALAALLALCLAEGLCRMLPFALECAAAAWKLALRGESHIRYDPLLGWSHIPGAAFPDMYGPGIGLHINAQGLREDRDVPPSAPRGKLRIVCSGESTTMGYGVADGETWCRRLEGLDPRLETINMGQMHYGLDQMYLWYLRDGVKFHPDIHIVALLEADIWRMGMPQILGMPKPVIAQSAEGLRVQPPGGDRGGLQARLELMSRSSNRLHPWSRLTPRVIGPLSPLINNRLEVVASLGRLRSEGPADWDRLRSLTLAVLTALQRSDAKQGSTLVVVWLPWSTQRAGDREALEIAELSRELERRGILSVDLAAEYSRWPIDRQDRLHMPDDPHYSEEGNSIVAEMIFRRLRSLPRAARRLAGARARRGSDGR